VCPVAGALEAVPGSALLFFWLPPRGVAMSRRNNTNIILETIVAVFFFFGWVPFGLTAALKIPWWCGVLLGLALLVPIVSFVMLVVWLNRIRKEAWLRTPAGLAWRRKQEESAARAKWSLYFESKAMREIAEMTGSEFEEFLARLIARMGYTDITLTPSNGDQGGDILCLSPLGARLVVQAKRWKGTVGNGAVQELLGAMLWYERNEGIVVTNSSFTEAARELAKKDSRIALRDGRWLEEQINKFLPPEIPEFEWEEYNRTVKHWQPAWASLFKEQKLRRLWQELAGETQQQQRSAEGRKRK
jgi:hypothetical protein